MSETDCGTILRKLHLLQRVLTEKAGASAGKVEGHGSVRILALMKASCKVGEEKKD